MEALLDQEGDYDEDDDDDDDDAGARRGILGPMVRIESSTSTYLLRAILMYKPKDLNREWSPRFSTLRDKNGWVRAITA